MKMQTEQNLALHLLAHREKGYSIAYVLRHSRILYAILVGILLLNVIGFCATDDLLSKALYLLGVGLVFGVLVRDAVWLCMIKRQWPFKQRIINWQKVEEIADGK